MGGSERTVVWFRRDLRIDDNPALAAAARDGSVLPVFIWCPAEEGRFYPGRCSRWWLKESLAHLGKSLEKLGCPLVLIRAEETTLAALLRCVDSVGATRVVYNHLYGTVASPSYLIVSRYRFLFYCGCYSNEFSDVRLKSLASHINTSCQLRLFRGKLARVYISSTCLTNFPTALMRKSILHTNIETIQI
jgi:cryptochrome 2